MRPFKFFFSIAVGMILFFFLARVLIAALFFAGVMSIGYFFFRKAKNFFRYLAWDDDDYRYAHYANQGHRRDTPLAGWKFENDLLVDDWDQPRERAYAERIISVG